ncbi:unnamed protein product, partial [Onchocerca ochengi]|uniref:Cyclic nucleotide-binding domain-containing protein n=1 Tax=Onchocerca ochengi TaxID=42157 RepID=A0A182EYQ9_ONCOC
MVLDRRRLLENWLFDLEQIVTVQCLSRHADISIDDAKETELHAVYVLSGKLKIRDRIIDNTCYAANTPKYRTQLVRDCNLEVSRQDYGEVITCEIYSLHTKAIK